MCAKHTHTISFVLRIFFYLPTFPVKRFTLLQYSRCDLNVYSLAAFWECTYFVSLAILNLARRLAGILSSRPNAQYSLFTQNNTQQYVLVWISSISRQPKFQWFCARNGGSGNHLCEVNWLCIFIFVNTYTHYCLCTKRLWYTIFGKKSLLCNCVRFVGFQMNYDIIDTVILLV